MAAEEARDPEPVNLVEARRRYQRLELKLDRMLAAIRASADRALRSTALGLSLRYEKQAPTGEERVHVRLELCRGGGRI